jgi:hypothetical protein
MSLRHGGVRGQSAPRHAVPRRVRAESPPAPRCVESHPPSRASGSS